MLRIRVINPVPGGVGISTKEDIDRLKAGASPETELSVSYITSGKPFIEGDFEDAYAVPGTVEAAIAAEREGMDAIIINCTADTGVSACRECVSIPVTAPTESAMHLAAQLSHRFSLLTFSRRTIPRFEKMAWKFGLGHKLASVRSVEIPLEKMDHQDEGLVRSLTLAGMQCIEADGAHCLLMGCTAFELVSQQLREKLAVKGRPVLILEPYWVALQQAESLVRMKLKHSKLSYPNPTA